MHSWPLFRSTKTYKGSFYLLVTLEKSLTQHLWFILLARKLKTLSHFQAAILFAVATPTLRELRCGISPIQRV